MQQLKTYFYSLLGLAFSTAVGVAIEFVLKQFESATCPFCFFLPHCKRNFFFSFFTESSGIYFSLCNVRLVTLWDLYFSCKVRKKHTFPHNNKFTIFYLWHKFSCCLLRSWLFKAISFFKKGRLEALSNSMHSTWYNCQSFYLHKQFYDYKGETNGDLVLQFQVSLLLLAPCHSSME